MPNKPDETDTPAEKGSMSEASKKSFDFAADSIKQLIALATGFIALSITFLKDIAPRAETHWLTLGWISFGLSTLFGILALLVLTGLLGHAAAKEKEYETPGVYSPPARLMSLLQIISFMVGLSCAIIFGQGALKARADASKESQSKATLELPNLTVTLPIEISTALKEEGTEGNPSNGNCSMSPGGLETEANVDRSKAEALIQKYLPDAQILDSALGVDANYEGCQRPEGAPVWKIAAQSPGSPVVDIYEIDAKVTPTEGSTRVRKLAVIDNPKLSKWGVRRYFCPLYPICR